MEYKPWFGSEYDWRGRVTRSVAGCEFELEIVGAYEAWIGTRVRFFSDSGDGSTQVRSRGSRMEVGRDAIACEPYQAVPGHNRWTRS